MSNVKKPEMNIEIFNPYMQKIRKMASNFKPVKVKNIHSKQEIKELKEYKKEFQQMRKDIKEVGMREREETNFYSKAVIKLEKNALAIIAEPEEQLKQEIDRVGREILLEERRDLLPARKKDLEKIGIEVSDDQLMQMDDGEFYEFKVSEQARINEEKEQEIERKEEEIKKKEEELERQEQIEKAKKAGERKAKKELKEKQEREEQERKVKRQEEKEKFDSDKKITAFLNKNNYSIDDDIIKEVGNEIRLYRCIAVHKK